MPDWRALYPFESKYQTINGWKYHYVDEGAPDAAPVLMSHGNPTWSFYYRNLIQAVRDTHRGIAVDHIGCGLSEKPAEFSYRLADHIDNLVQFIEALDLQNITLVVHDWGGAIGLGAALKVPERFARLVLLNTAAFPPPYCPLRIRVCRTPLLGEVALQGLNMFARSAITMAVENPQNMTPQVRAGLLAPYDSWANRRATHRFVKDIPLSRRHPTWQVLEDIEAGLSTLAGLPVQMIWGMRDWCFRPECLERLLKSFPDAEVHRLDQAGHYVIEDDPQRVTGLIQDFLAK